MQRGSILEFACQKCQREVCFSLFEIEQKKPVICSNCEKKYSFSDENLVRQLKKFSALCTQIREAEEILGNASIGVDIADKSIKIPFKLLLTRLSSQLDLQMGDQKISIAFRLEPVKDALLNQ